MTNEFTIPRELLQELNNFLNSNEQSYNLCDIVRDNGIDYIYCEIHDGDWKHDHAALQYYVKKFFDEHPNWYLKDIKRKNYKGSDGDWYSQDYYFEIAPYEGVIEDEDSVFTTLSNIEENYDSDEDIKRNHGYRDDTISTEFKVGDRVAHKYADLYNVGTILNIQEDESGIHYQIEWDYSDGDSIEWLFSDEITHWVDVNENLKESWSRTTNEMIDAIDNAQFLLNDSNLEEFETILKSCGANDDDSDPDLGYFLGMSDDQILSAYNQVKELLKRVIRNMSPVEINNRFFSYSNSGSDIIDAFDIQLNHKGELIESLYNPDTEYTAKETSYEIAKKIAQLAKRALKLPVHEVEMLEHDINNLRSNEWVESFAELSDTSQAKKLFFTYAVKAEEEDELTEDIKTYELEDSTLTVSNDSYITDDKKISNMHWIKTEDGEEVDSFLGVRITDSVNESDKLGDEIIEESVKSSPAKLAIEEMVKDEFETGHRLCYDYEDFKEGMRESGLRGTPALWDYYQELRELGPVGFYEEFKDKYEFDSMFISEYGGEDGEEYDDDIDDSIYEGFEGAPRVQFPCNGLMLKGTLSGDSTTNPDVVEVYIDDSYYNNEPLTYRTITIYNPYEDRYIKDNKFLVPKDKITYIKDKIERTKICVICGRPYTGYGNNAAPVAEGQCCDECNLSTVIPTRFKLS